MLSYKVSMQKETLQAMPRNLRKQIKPSSELAARCLLNDSRRHQQALKSGCGKHIVGHADGKSYCLTCTVRTKAIHKEIEQIYGGGR